METFKNPPITEAIIDIRAVSAPGVDLEALKDFAHGLESRFPLRQEHFGLQQTFQVKLEGGPPKISSSTAVDGLLFRSSDNQRVVQARLNGFAFNRLRPYDRWEKFSAEALELWERYKSVARPVNVTRIGVRYLNRILLPLPVSNYREYCLLFPEFPKEFSSRTQDFFLHFSLRLPTFADAAAVTNLAFEPLQPNATSLPLILDLDTFFQFTVCPPDSEEIWAKLGVLRNFKNYLFDSSLTEKAKDLFR
jgi:uncharacterized protein (TIGR04255 family)